MQSNLDAPCTSTEQPYSMLLEDPDLFGGLVITCPEDSAALATEMWGAAVDGEVPEHIQAIQATEAAVVAEYQVCTHDCRHMHCQSTSCRPDEFL